jgi:hypothetical protein
MRHNEHGAHRQRACWPQNSTPRPTHNSDKRHTTNGGRSAAHGTAGEKT